METLKERDRLLEELWEQFADCPMDPDTEKMDEQFLHFPAGTDREEIWHWFDERHSKGVAYLLYGDGIDRTPDTAKLCYLKQLCFDCESETCAFNPDGVCMYPVLYGRVPEFDDDVGCRGFLYKGES